MAKCQRAIKLLRTGKLETQQHFKIILHDGGDFKHSHETRRSWSFFFIWSQKKLLESNVIANFVLNKIVLNIFFFFFCRQDEYRSCWPKFENSADFILGFCLPPSQHRGENGGNLGFLPPHHPKRIISKIHDTPSVCEEDPLFMRLLTTLQVFTACTKI